MTGYVRTLEVVLLLILTEMIPRLEEALRRGGSKTRNLFSMEIE